MNKKIFARASSRLKNQPAHGISDIPCVVIDCGHKKCMYNENDGKYYEAKVIPFNEEDIAPALQIAILDELRETNRTLRFFKALTVIAILISVLAALGAISSLFQMF